MTELRRLTVNIPTGLTVSGLLLAPERTSACYVMAHGAGAGMTHPFMMAVSAGLSGRRIATLRYDFPYMEQGSKRTDRPEIARAAVRAAVQAAARLMPSVPIVAGGKSFGARMTSQAQAESPLAGVCGLTFFGFPLHPAKKPSDDRARHLDELNVPMLFLQGTRDALADMRLLVPIVESLKPWAMLQPIEDADHSFHVPARSGRTDAEVLAGALDAMVAWVDAIGLQSPTQMEA